MATQLILATLIAGLTTVLIIARYLRILGFKNRDDVHRLQTPVRVPFTSETGAVKYLLQNPLDMCGFESFPISLCIIHPDARYSMPDAQCSMIG